MGRYEEAIPFVKRALARYPNVISIRLSLITCYVELGRSEDARAEAAEVLRINPKFSLAVRKQMFPIKEPLQARHYEDLAKAGLK
jgi:adenylate cyclase